MNGLEQCNKQQSALKAETPNRANEPYRVDRELAEEIRGRQEGGQER